MNGREWRVGCVSTDFKREGDREPASSRDRRGWMWSQTRQAESRREAQDLLLELLESGPWQPKEGRLANHPQHQLKKQEAKSGELFSMVLLGRGTNREAQRAPLKFIFKVHTKFRFREKRSA